MACDETHGVRGDGLPLGVQNDGDSICGSRTRAVPKKTRSFLASFLLEQMRG